MPLNPRVKPKSSEPDFLDSSAAVNRVTKAVIAVAGDTGRYFYQAFGAFLEATIDSIYGREWSIDEDLKPHVDRISEAYAMAVAECEPYTDILGPVYMDLAHRGNQKFLGQFFTPQNIADMMAMMTYSNDLYEERMAAGDPTHLVRMIDPTCGSGVMMLSALRHVHKQFGNEALAYTSVTGVDLDHYCAMVTTVQMVANNTIFGLQPGEIVVVNGNSLFPDKWWKPLLHANHPRLDPVTVLSARDARRQDAVREAAVSAGVDQQVSETQDLDDAQVVLPRQMGLF